MTGPDFIAWALGAVLAAGAVSAEPPLAPEVLQQTARDPHWLALIQRARQDPDRSTREALEAAGFLLSRDSTAEGELVATLDALLATDPDRRQAAHCRFPARHQFLSQRGLVPGDRGPCVELDAWREEIGEFGLTLIFPESFLGNPASMFGHTLLRFDPAETNADHDALLGWALDYTADAEGQAGALYLMRGLLGGYRGRFSLDPYYQKTTVYSDWQDRDIWEYPLTMSRDDRERLLLHVWELRDVALPYYFFTQNCSEKILELLEVVWPGLGRGGGFPPTVAPVDTVRAIGQHENHPLGLPLFRESPATRLQRTMASMPTREARLVEDLAFGRAALDDEGLAALPDSARARILESAYDLLRHRYLAGKIDDESSRGRSRALLLARSRIPPARIAAEGAEKSASGGQANEGPLADSSPHESPPAKRPPDSGHGTARVELAGGIQDRDGFIELRLQPAYHELLDAPGGYAEGGQIRVLDTRVRYFPALERVRLHELVLLDVMTASPWRQPFRPLGWRFDLGLRTRLLTSERDRGLDTEGVFRIQGGVGGATAPLRGLLLYGFGELVIESGPGLEGDVAGGPVTRSGLTWTTPGERVSLQLEAIAGLLAGERTAPWLRLELAQRTALSQRWSLVLSGRYEHAYDVGHIEGRLGLLRYF